MKRIIGASLIMSLFVLGFAWAVPVQAQGASAWSGDQKGRVRLIAGARMPDGKLLAGLEVDLAEGWKTYWRVPGDSGVPAVFDWTKSKNIKAIKVHWPAPTRFKDKYGWNNGYKEDFVFPVEIQPKNPAEPVELDQLLHYGVCEDLCIPGKANLALSVPPEGYSGHQVLIGRYLQMVPQPANKDSAIQVAAVDVQKAGQGLSLNVTLNTRSAEPVSLFVEGPSAFFFDVPKQDVSGDVGKSSFKVLVDGAKAASELKGQELKFTAVQGELRLEQIWRVD